ncbi:hypothetical protein [Streptomyces sp. NPDC054901]
MGLTRVWSLLLSRRGDEREAAEGARAYPAHNDGDLEPWLRGYLLRL